MSSKLSSVWKCIFLKGITEISHLLGKVSFIYVAWYLNHIGLSAFPQACDICSSISCMIGSRRRWSCRCSTVCRHCIQIYALNVHSRYPVLSRKCESAYSFSRMDAFFLLPPNSFDVAIEIYDKLMDMSGKIR